MSSPPRPAASAIRIHEVPISYNARGIADGKIFCARTALRRFGP